MHESFDDPIQVAAIFDHGRVKPVYMRWSSRVYKLDQVNLVHTARDGAKLLHYFSVSDSTTSFKLRFDPELLSWHLLETYSP